MPKIQSLVAREIFDSRGTPTVEVDLTLDDGSFGRAAVPSGASTGIHEAVELRDESDKRLGGKGVRTAVKNVTEVLLPALKGMEAEQRSIDQKMIEVDGTPNKGKIGANALLGVSMALSKALAISQKKPLWDYFRSLSTTVPSEYWMPVPMMNILNGGKHASKSCDFQEFMVMPISATSFREAMDMGASVFMALKKLLHKEGFSTTVGDEGGFAPSLGQNVTALEKIQQAVTLAGYDFGKDIVVALDAASSEFYMDGKYNLASEEKFVTPGELADMYEDWTKKYPIASIEDAFEQDGWDDYKALTQRIGDKVQLVGDDLFVTHVGRLKQGIDNGIANAILIKLNQIGTVTETVDAIDLARKNGYKAIISHRSGETEDTTIADFVVGLSTGQIKTGSLSRTDRVAKYNQLLRIEEALGDKAIYPGAKALAR
jgi:enolase